MSCLDVERVHIFRGRMRLTVRVSDQAPLRTSDEVAARVLAKRPELAVHSCVNATGPTFGDVIADTTLPHLLEHLIIAEQARLLGDGLRNEVLVGTTELVADRRAVVEISFVDDLVAVAALRRGLAILDDAVTL